MDLQGERVGALGNMTVVIDYDAGNLYNVANALRFLGVEYEFSGEPDVVRRASKVILPGVGSARAAMNSLKRQGLSQVIHELEVPFLGICLGLQLLYKESQEEAAECLGVLPGRVEKFDSTVAKVPHIGWNRVVLSESAANCSLFEGIPSGSFFYFVHSYYAPVAVGLTQATTDYETSFSSVIQRDNFVACQFHPERSGEVGLRLLDNFLRM
jgi:glutamine amidotransferase